MIKKLIEKKTGVQVFTGGKKYTGCMSGVGHSWTLAGVNAYKSSRKRLVSDVKEYKNIHLNCKKKEEKFGLTEIVKIKIARSSRQCYLMEK